MKSAKEIADLIQMSIEDDVDDITSPEGGVERAHMDITVGKSMYKIVVHLQESLSNEVEDDDDEEDEDEDSKELAELMFE